MDWYYPGLEKLKRALGEGLDIHSYYGERGSIEGVDAHFLVVAWKQNYTVRETTHRVSEFWTSDGIYVTKDYTEVLIKSRRAFRYPYIAFDTKLPQLTVDGTKINFGLENDSMYRTGTTQFTYERDGGVNRLFFYVASQRNLTKANIDFAKPADAETAGHTYAIKVNKGFAEYFIDGELVGVAVFGAIPWTWGRILSSSQPYAIILSKTIVNPIMVLSLIHI